jgi:hypothetical protein
MMNVGDYNKAIFQFRSAVTEVLSIYDGYGLDVYNKEGHVTNIMLKLALQLHARIEGADVPIGQDFELVSIVGEEPDD